MRRDLTATVLGFVFLLATQPAPTCAAPRSGPGSPRSSSSSQSAGDSSGFSSFASSVIERDHELGEGQGDPRPEPPKATACADARSHDFDFWIGEWDVYAGGALAGHNSIRPLVDGCVLHESWRGAQGGAGTSLNFYNTRTGRWQQFWVWRNGTTLELEGTYDGGRMVLEGKSVDAQGAPRRNRITWSANEDGTVRQRWEVSTDGGAAWRTVFDGHYRKSESISK